MSDKQQELNEAEEMILQVRENCRIQTERADAAEKENKRLQGLMTEALHIEKLHFENGKLELSGTHPLGEAVIAALVSVFASSFSENYLEMQVYHPEVGPLAVVLQRLEGKTPAQVASELRAVVREADEYLDTNSLTNIGHGSTLHQKFKALLPKKVE